MSKIEVNTVDVQCGSTLTLGSSGKTVTLACGATQSGFGRTGTVDWQTSSIKTATFTAENGKGYFCNTAGGAFTINLPAGAAGSIVSVQDYNNTFDTYGLTVDANGSEKINGGDGGAAIVLNTQGQGVTFVYIDATVGWRSVQDNTFDSAGSNFIIASGGNATVTCGDFKTHIFTADGDFSVTAAGSPGGSDVFEYLVVAGGAASGSRYFSGGGGAGGFRTFQTTPAASPLKAPAGLTASTGTFPITVGGGGAAHPGNPAGARGCSGSNSVFSTITSAGGGGGGFNDQPGGGGNGGSGGGGGSNAAGSLPGGSGNTPPVSPPQGNNGGNANPGASYVAGGGGGASAVGNNYNASPNPGAGGAGSFIENSFVGPTAPSYGETGPAGRYFSGGGGAGAGDAPGPTLTSGGLGGGGNGSGNATQGAAGDTNTGGGGGGTGNNSPAPAPGAAGGSGIVIIRYKFQ